MRMGILAAACAAVALACAGQASADVNLVTNGDFATGDLSGWTLALSAPDSGGFAPDPYVTNVTIPGFGATNAAEFQVGHCVAWCPVGYANNGSVPGPNGYYYGAMLSQQITTTDGLLHISAGAAVDARAGNGEPGTFEVLLDGHVLTAWDGAALDGWTSDILTFDTDVTAGTHTLGFSITRYYASAAGGGTPFQYLTAISAAQAVPEPSTWALMLTGLGLLGVALRRRPRRGALAA